MIVDINEIAGAGSGGSCMNDVGCVGCESESEGTIPVNIQPLLCPKPRRATLTCVGQRANNNRRVFWLSSPDRAKQKSVE